MVTIAHLVTKYLEDKPFLQEALAKGIIHFGGLADQLKPWIERELGKKIKHSAVMMALRRYAEKLEKKFKKIFPKDKLKELELSIKSNIVDITLLKSPTIFSVLKRLYGMVDFSKGDMLNIVQGSYEITLIINQRYKEKFLQEFKKAKEQVKHVEEHLSALSIKFPPEFIYTPGFFFILVKELAWNNINIIDMVSTLTEITFILSERDAVKAFNVLQALKR